MAENLAQTRFFSPSQANGQFNAGKVTFPATAIVATDYTEIDVGYRPKYVRWTNLTDRVTIEFFEGMTQGTCLKTAASGTQTLESANGGITLTDFGFQVLQNATLAAILASKDCYWKASA